MVVSVWLFLFLSDVACTALEGFSPVVVCMFVEFMLACANICIPFHLVNDLCHGTALSRTVLSNRTVDQLLSGQAALYGRRSLSSPELSTLLFPCSIGLYKHSGEC